ncbi:MAG: N-6 DNA methylase [Bacteroides sp.]|nr:N-6 DNA methylase [Bacteroides sp.]
MKVKNVSYKKLTGSYYTPHKIAEYLWHYVSKSNPKQILEPSAGIGDLLISIPSSIKVDSIEIQKMLQSR